MDLKSLVMQSYNDHINKKAEEKGLSVDEYLKQVENEQRTVEKSIVNEEENILENIFSQSVDEYIRSTKSNITKIVKWTSSKFNDYRKKDVVDWVYDVANNPSEEYLKLFECGAYSDISRSKNASNHGFDQYLAVKDGKVRWAYALGSEWQRIYEFN